MSSDAPDDFRPRRGRTGLVVVLVLLAFVVGSTLASWAIYSGWLPALTTRADEARRAAPAGFTPAQPLTSTGAPPPVDPATLVTREAALAAQLSVLEARAAAVASDAAGASAQATRAEGLMVAFAARRAIDRGTPLGYLEEQLRARFVPSQPRAVAVVIAAAQRPVTIEDLRQGLDAIAPALQTGADEDWLAALRHQLGGLVVLRREDTPSTAPVDRIARARRLLDDGQVAGARAEIARLPGAEQADAWLAAARRYVLARQALDVIETAAILGQAHATETPARSAAPSTATAPATTTSTQTDTIS